MAMIKPGNMDFNEAIRIANTPQPVTSTSIEKVAEQLAPKAHEHDFNKDISAQCKWITDQLIPDIKHFELKFVNLPEDMAVFICECGEKKIVIKSENKELTLLPAKTVKPNLVGKYTIEEIIKQLAEEGMAPVTKSPTEEITEDSIISAQYEVIRNLRQDISNKLKGAYSAVEDNRQFYLAAQRAGLSVQRENGKIKLVK